LKYFIFFTFLFFELGLAKEVIQKELLIGVVKAESAAVRNKKSSSKDFIVNTYSLGTVLDLDYCDEHQWCKLKDQELFIPKYFLGIMKNPNIHSSSKKSTIPKAKLLKAKCIKLTQINMSENELLDINTQNKLFSEYKNNDCINGKTIKKILNKISVYYSNKGYVTTRPFLKPQNLKKGKLNIDVSLGKIDKIIDSESNKNTSNISFAFIGQEDEALNLRDLETSLEAMNRVPSSKSTFKIAPSKKRGNSIIKVITQKTQEPYDLSVGVIGEENFKDKNPALSSNFLLYNPLSINDILKFTLNGSRIQKEYQSTKANEINYSFSVGTYVLEFIKSYSTYRQGIDGINDTYLSNGHIHGYKTRISKILYRNQKNKLSSAFSIHHKKNKNYFEGNEIETSSYKTTQAQLDLIHTFLQRWGQVSTTLSLYQGKDWLGARSDEYVYAQNDYENNTKLEFTKYSLDINTFYNFYTNHSLQSNLYYQYSNDKLYNSDKLTLGGNSSVRGYSSDYYGNSAWYIRNTLNKKINLDKTFLKSISFYLGLDYGKAKCENNNEGNCGSMYGGAVGLKSKRKEFQTDFYFTRPLKKLDENYELKNNFNWTITMIF
jgi:hemolysin activation/secretion protein